MPAQQEVTRFLTAIGDPARLEIMFVLGKQDRLNVTDLASNFRISRSAVSHHLKVLRDAEVVCNEKIGQEVFYWLDIPSVVSKLRDLSDALEAYKKDGKPE